MNVQTVLGKVDARELGRTLTHEHIHLDYQKFYVPPPPGLEKFLDGEITLNNVGFVQRYPYSSMFNLSFNSSDVKRAVINDIEIFKKFGGGSIVENTNYGLERNLNFLKTVSQSTGVHIIAGTGYYIASVQDESTLNQTVESLYKVIKKEIMIGSLDNPEIKCGFIGEVASDFPIHNFEKNVIQAAAEVQEQLKCPVSFHPGRNPQAPSEVMRLYTEAGGDAKKAVMSHLDRTFNDWSQFLDFASEYKCFLQQDLFGTEVLMYQFRSETQMPNDAHRVQTIKMLIDHGYSDRILVSHDVHTKHRLIEFGGHGYCHLFKNVVPKMLAENISQTLIDEITIENPKNWLSWNCAR